MSPVSIEELAKKFVALASIPTLSKAQHEEARKLMRQLKQAGMTNEEIAGLSKGKWTLSTVKGYTKGVKAASPNPWQDAVGLLDNLISASMTLDDVETAVTVFENLKSHDIDLNQVVELLLAAHSASLDVTALVQQHQGLSELGLSLKDVAEVLSCKKELEQRGLGLDSLEPLLELAKNYGNPQGIIEALSKYTSFTELDEQISVAKEGLESLTQQLVGAHQQLKEIETKSSQLKEPLDAYEKAVKLGFSQAELVALSTLAEKHGTVKKILQAVKAFADYSDILNKIDKAKVKLTSIETKTQQLETQYAHLKTATTMCQTLIDQYKFGLDAISTILSVAKKLGEPIDVLKSIEAYGKLQVVQQELGKQEGKVSEIKKEIAQLEGEHKKALEKLESLNVLALKVGNEVGKVQGELAASNELKKIVNFMNNPALADYAEHILTALMVTVSLRKWVSAHEVKFKSPNHIKSGLETLIRELGGLP